MPALNAAIDSLKALNKNDIVEIKSFAKPPPLVQMTLEAVCILKQEKPDWDTVRQWGMPGGDGQAVGRAQAGGMEASGGGKPALASRS
jgi:hypothetical protein